MPPPSSDIFTDNMPFLSSDIFTDGAHMMYTDPSSVIPTSVPTPQQAPLDMSNWPEFNFDFGDVAPMEADAGQAPDVTKQGSTPELAPPADRPNSESIDSTSFVKDRADQNVNIDGAADPHDPGPQKHSSDGTVVNPNVDGQPSGEPISMENITWNTTLFNFDLPSLSQDDGLPPTQHATPTEASTVRAEQQSATATCPSTAEAGSKESPIQIESETPSKPKPVNRVLFPSPRKPGEFKSLEDKTPSTKSTPSRSRSQIPTTPKRRSPRRHNTRTPGGTVIPILEDTSAVTAEAADPTSTKEQTALPIDNDNNKENLLPHLPFTPRKGAIDSDDGFGYLFGDGPTPRKTPLKFSPLEFDFDLPKPTPRTQKLIDALLSDAPGPEGYEGGLGSPVQWGIGE